MKRGFILTFARMLAKVGYSRFYRIKYKKKFYIIYVYNEERYICVTDGSIDRYLTFNLG